MRELKDLSVQLDRKDRLVLLVSPDPQEMLE